MKVKIFIWVAMQNKTLTQEILMIRGCNITPGWVLCQDSKVETTEHIMYWCSYSEGVWRGLLQQHGITQHSGNWAKLHEFWWEERMKLQPSIQKLLDPV